MTIITQLSDNTLVSAGNNEDYAIVKFCVHNNPYYALVDERDYEQADLDAAPVAADFWDQFCDCCK